MIRIVCVSVSGINVVVVDVLVDVEVEALVEVLVEVDVDVLVDVELDVLVDVEVLLEKTVSSTKNESGRVARATCSPSWRV